MLGKLQKMREMIASSAVSPAPRHCPPKWGSVLLVEVSFQAQADTIPFSRLSRGVVLSGCTVYPLQQPLWQALLQWPLLPWLGGDLMPFPSTQWYFKGYCV